MLIMSTSQCHVGVDRREAAASTIDRAGLSRPSVRVSDAVGITIVEFRDAGFLFAQEDIDAVAEPPPTPDRIGGPGWWWTSPASG